MYLLLFIFCNIEYFVSSVPFIHVYCSILLWQYYKFNQVHVLVHCTCHCYYYTWLYNVYCPYTWTVIVYIVWKYMYLIIIHLLHNYFLLTKICCDNISIAVSLIQYIIFEKSSHFINNSNHCFILWWCFSIKYKI